MRLFDRLFIFATQVSLPSTISDTMLDLLRRRRFILLILAALLPFGFISISLASAWFFVSPAHTDVDEPPADLADSLVDVDFTASDGTRLSGWFGSAGDGKQGVILLHGYRGNRTHMTERARFLMSHGYSVLLYDARGCGESAGDLISIGYHETADLLAAIDLMKKSGVERIGLLGVSQGGATVLLASGRLDGIGCVIVESTYDNIENAIDRRFRHYIALPGSVGASLLLPIAERRIGIAAAQISPIDSMRSLRAPILVISGEDDTRTTAEDTRRLFAHAPEPKELWMIPGADHENLQAFAGEEYTLRVVRFFDRYLALPPPFVRERGSGVWEKVQSRLNKSGVVSLESRVLGSDTRNDEVALPPRGRDASTRDSAYHQTLAPGFHLTHSHSPFEPSKPPVRPDRE